MSSAFNFYGRKFLDIAWKGLAESSTNTFEEIVQRFSEKTAYLEFNSNDTTENLLLSLDRTEVYLIFIIYSINFTEQ